MRMKLCLVVMKVKMNKILIINFILLSTVQIICLTSGKVIAKKTYVGAVVEYANIFDQRKSATENIQQNIDHYAKFIKSANDQSADIIVFPEYGLTSTYITNNYKEAILYSSEIPHPQEMINPCEESKRKKNNNCIFPAWSDILTEISCEAQKNKIYVVINLPERVKFKDDWLLFNTNIVFDRNGLLISRYRKYNLYNEPAFNTTNEAEIESFTTDFGVTFGTITCFDILYGDPVLSLIRNKGVTDLLFPTAWLSKMPFLTAIQTQAGFAKAYGVNLLASNYDNPDNFGGGSGMYSTSRILTYTIPVVKQSKMLVAKISKLQNNINNYYSENQLNNVYDKRKHLYLETLTERWDGFTTEILETNVKNRVICNEQLCCKFSVKATVEISDYIYRLVVTDSFRSSGINRHHVQMCGIVACANQSLESCGQRLKNTPNPKLFEDVSISGNFSTDKKFVQFPSIVNYNLSTLPFDSYSYNVKPYNYFTNTIQLQMKYYIEKVLCISIYGRSKA